MTAEEFSTACAGEAWYVNHQPNIEDGAFMAAVLAEASRLRAKEVAA